MNTTSEVEGDIAYMATGYEVATPSRHRTTPSGAVAWAWEQLKQQHLPLTKALDLGCGRGRNTLFLARKGMEVTAIDFAPQAIAELQKMASLQKVDHKIHSIVQSVTDGWPVAPESIDLIVDAFCFKHLSAPEEYEMYKANLLRALDKQGHYLISFTSIGDGYYGRYMRQPKQLPVPVDDAVYIDPMNGVECAFYSRDRLIAFLRPELDLCAELKNLNPDYVAKDDGTYALLFRRRHRHIGPPYIGTL